MHSSNKDGDPAFTSVAEALTEARRKLPSRLEVDLLACRALACERSWLYAHGDDAMPDEALARLRRLVEERLHGRPIAQLCGGREFYGREFSIDERVLIPRPETELLVDLALALPLSSAAQVCDVGTGSGCIALTLAAERPGWRLTAIDSSGDALAVAADNRAKMGLERVELLDGDLFAPVGERRFDLIVSNPPYVADEDPHLQLGDLRFEPESALAAGADGLDVIRRLTATAFDRLNPGGWLLIEHGHDQATAVRGLLEGAGFIRVESQRDLAGIERVGMGMRPA
ncbi:MAG: peptide chain release factor N(5)-glutamine methyltransferase [Xanthomonadales bacterium]|nr:peptide chain release factor N(5)-glutamine methyltransferase [Xanthomonadales bacterium]